ncbi:hypothetical protein [Maricaulis sp.]|uniref:hypothetical protein n=1 Tax=Maricaulis sp. TaxID=1486257 RepID=UPI000C5D6FFB|nr:hypothetical protein [Maricaulis sp.]MAC89641.1 hypothetical protein [Maricaulis sp.]
MSIAAYILVGIVALYPIFAFLLVRSIRPHRQRLADLGRALLQSPDLSEQHKRFITVMLDDAFSWKVMWWVAFGFFGRLVSLARMDHDTTKRMAETRAFVEHPQVREFVTLHTLSVAVANPLGFVIYALEMAIAMLVLRSVTAGLRLAVALSVSSNPDLDHSDRNGSPA